MAHWRKYFEEKYLGAWVMDDAGRDLTVTIERLQVEEVMNPDTNSKEKKLVIHFRGKKKGMVCNKTNARTVAALYGDDTDKWVGKQITLYATTITAFGKEHRCIRIRDRVPQQQPPHDPETGEVREGAQQPQPEPRASSDNPVSY